MAHPITPLRTAPRPRAGRAALARTACSPTCCSRTGASPPEVLRRFELAELAGNTSRIAAAAPLLVVLHAGHALVLGLVGPDEGRSADWRWWLCAAHAVMLVAALGFGLMARRASGASAPSAWTSGLFVAGYLIFAAWIAGIDQLVTPNITPFTVAVFGTSTLVPLSLKLSLLLLPLGFLVLIAALFIFAASSPSLTSNILNGSTIVAAGWVIGRALRSARAKNAAQAMTIEEQRAALTAANAELRKLADIDAMTGVPNRRSLLERAARMRAHATRHGEGLAMLMIDVDRFKDVNDHFGHARGDTVLIDVVAACRAVLRGEDVLGRVGGEEFVALLPQCDADGVLLVAERMRERVETLALPHPSRPAVTVSLGLSLVSTDPALSDDVALDLALEAADVSLYAAKNEGRNRVGPLASAPIPREAR